MRYRACDVVCSACMGNYGIVRCSLFIHKFVQLLASGSEDRDGESRHVLITLGWMNFFVALASKTVSGDVSVEFCVRYP